MTFEEAIVIAVRKYYAGKDPEALIEASESLNTLVNISMSLRKS
jgi:hypothetical protein